jgi:hypothetical protein
MLTGAAIGALAAWATACSGAGPQPFELDVSPFDGLTGLPALELQIGTTTNPSGPDPDSHLGPAIAAATKLWTWPDLVPVATTVGGVVLSNVPDGVDVSATMPVPDGWYAAIVDHLPSNVRSDGDGFHVLPGGRPAVRLHVGSAPALWGVAACPRDAGREVTVMFTEDVVAATTATMPISVTAGPTGVETVCEVSSPPLADRGAASYTYECAGSRNAIAVTVTVTTGLLSKTGLEVPVVERTIAAAAFRLDRTDPRCGSFKLDP